MLTYRSVRQPTMFDVLNAVADAIDNQHPGVPLEAYWVRWLLYPMWPPQALYPPTFTVRG
jgi:hypothetical protein